MSGATNYLENAAADHVVGTAALTSPANVYVKLHTADPGEDAVDSPAMGSAASEADRRELVAFNPASGGIATSLANVTWLSCSDAETITHFSIWDSDTAGNPLVYGQLLSAKTVSVGDNFIIPAGQLSVTLT